MHVSGNETRATFYRMSVRGSPLRLSLCLFPLFLLPLELLYPKMVFMDGDAQYYLGAVLVNDEAVQLRPQRLGRDVAGAYITGTAQGPSERLVRLIEGGEALPAEVGAVVCGRSAGGWKGSPARNTVERPVGGAGLWRGGVEHGPWEHHGGK